MFSEFTSADRRKKVVTYGKSSRLSTITTPAPATNDDALSPERPREPAATSNGSLTRLGGRLNDVSSSRVARTNTESADIFDVPSEDEFVSRSIKPTKNFPRKHRTPEDDFDVPLSEDEAPAPSRRAVNTVQALRKPDTAKTAVLAERGTQKPVQLLKSTKLPLPPSEHPVVPRGRRGKTPQAIQQEKQGSKNGDLVQKPTAVAKLTATSRASTPVLSPSRAQKNTKSISVQALNKTAVKTSATRKIKNLDVFDVPSSDDEAPLPTRKSVSQVQTAKSKEAAKHFKVANGTHKDSVESDDSNTSKKRKRKGSISSVTTSRPTIEQNRESSIPHRGRKYQKKDDAESPGLDTPHQPAVPSEAKGQATMPTINKPRRTRLRTVPVIARPTVSKGQSSPAMLNSMLPDRQTSKPSPIAEVPQVTALEDETMYEIPDPLATPVRPTRTVTSGSVTPRQKALFSSLLGESSSSHTDMPSISALQLTSPKPNSVLGALSRSKSDITYSAQARKTRLIDTIKRDETSSEEEDEEDDSMSESDEEPAKRNTYRRVVEHLSEGPQTARPSAEILSDNMEVDEVVAESQASQPPLSHGTRARFTYAKSRSYLQEANPEDDFLISMDLDENLGFDSQKKNGLSEDEDDPTSQVQAHHELKRQGQQKAFQWEAEMSIDDISNKTSNSIRRSAMLELSTKMADATFTGQLLDSSLAHQFFENTSSNGEIVFDFATAVAIGFVLKTNPNYSVLDQLRRNGIIGTLMNLVGNDMDIQRISRDRKTNLSKIAQESVLKFRTLVQDSSIWLSGKPEKLSPQIVALQALDSLIVGLRKSGSSELLLDQAEISSLVNVASKPCERVKDGQGLTYDTLVLNSILSLLEAISVSRQKQPLWSTGILQRLADLLPVFFKPNTISSAMLAVKLCMNLTNNKPKACQPFSGKTFVQPLVTSIIYNFGLLNAGIGLEQRPQVYESLILSLGAMINLAEFSDSARLSVNKDQAIVTLVKIFLEGSERASEANSMEESHSSVAVGYLAVLLGNLCLNSTVRAKIRAQLPSQQLDTLIDKTKEFVRFHEHVDRKTKHFEGEEGQETWQNYTARLMLVVEKLEKAEQK